MSEAAKLDTLARAAKVQTLFGAGHKKPEAGTVHWFNQCVERGKSEVFSEVTIVTPGLASVLLEKNPDNRNVRAARLEQFASDMRADRWTFNGEPLIISADGLLNDGQHRLRAIVEANTTIPMLLVFGVDRAARMTVDQGAMRSAGDFLGMDGIENSVTAASIARLVVSIERERMARLHRENETTSVQVRQRVMRDPKIADAATYAQQVFHYTKALASPAIIGTAFYFLSDVHPADGREFMDQVCIGEELRRDSPAYAVRNALLSINRGRRAAKLEAIFRGWIKYRAGEPLMIAKVLGHFPELD